ncbi:MAG: MucBP domain-containing protein [Lentilactobacillus diolivorans]
METQDVGCSGHQTLYFQYFGQKATVTVEFKNVNDPTKPIREPIILDQGTVHGKYAIPRDNIKIPGYKLVNSAVLEGIIDDPNQVVELQFEKADAKPADSKKEKSLIVNSVSSNDHSNAQRDVKDNEKVVSIKKKSQDEHLKLIAKETIAVSNPPLKQMTPESKSFTRNNLHDKEINQNDHLKDKNSIHQFGQQGPRVVPEQILLKGGKNDQFQTKSKRSWANNQTIVDESANVVSDQNNHHKDTASHAKGETHIQNSNPDIDRQDTLSLKDQQPALTNPGKPSISEDHDSKESSKNNESRTKGKLNIQSKEPSKKNNKRVEPLKKKPQLFTVHVQGFDNDGRRLFDSDIKASSTDLSQLTHEDIEFYGYDLDTQDYDSKTNILTLHYHPRKLTLKISNMDENGEIISSREVPVNYGMEFTITPQEIDGYRAVSQAKSVRIDKLLMPIIYVRYHKDLPAPVDRLKSSTSNLKQDPSVAINNIKESTPSADVPVNHTEINQKTDLTKQRKTNKSQPGKRGKSKLVHSKKQPKKQAKRDKLLKQRRKTGRNSRKSFVKNSNRRQKRTNQKQLPQTGESHSKQTLLFGWLLLVGLACQKSFKWLH